VVKFSVEFFSEKLKIDADFGSSGRKGLKGETY